MKKITIYFIGVFFCILSYADGLTEKIGDEQFSKISSHPRLFLTPQKKDAILKLVKTNPQAKEFHELIIKNAYEKLKKSPVKRKDTGFRMGGGGEASGKFEAWGYAWIMTGDNSLLFSDKSFYEEKNFSAKGVQNKLLMIYASDFDFDKIVEPKEKTWVEYGSENPVFFARTGWSKEDLFFGVKGGQAITNHGHMDASSFVFDANGERWAFDLGAQNYHSLEKLGMKIWGGYGKKNCDRWKVWRYTNHTHNMLTVNDDLIDPNALVKISESSSDEKNMSVVLDTTKLYSPYLKKSCRKVALMNSAFLRVVDKIDNSDKPSKIRWTVCTHKTCELVGDKTIKVKSSGGKILLMKLKSPQNFKAEIRSADSANSWDTKNPDYALATFVGDLLPNENIELIVDLVPQN